MPRYQNLQAAFYFLLASPDSNEVGIPPESSHPCESTEGEGLRRSKDDQQEEEEEWEQVGPKNKSTITRQVQWVRGREGGREG